MRGLLKHRLLNQWPLFWLLTAPVSLVMVAAMLGGDTASGAGVSALIQLSVRLAVPFLYLAFSASAVQILWPGALGLWWLRNRKIFGLCFAAAMAWQAFFIIWLVTVYRAYYISEVYVLRDAIEGVVGYAFLVAMTVSSFMAVRKRMRPRHWKWLHKAGIYWLWMYAFSVYWWNLSYYPEPQALDYLYYYAGLAAWCLRAAAWRHKRLRHLERHSPPLAPAVAPLVAGLGLVAAGMLAANTGVLWQGPSEALLLGHAATRWAELYLPYWPFEPFLPLVVIGVGVWMSVRPGRALKRATRLEVTVRSGA